MVSLPVSHPATLVELLCMASWGSKMEGTWLMSSIAGSISESRASRPDARRANVWGQCAEAARCLISCWHCMQAHRFEGGEAENTPRHKEMTGRGAGLTDRLHGRGPHAATASPDLANIGGAFSPPSSLNTMRLTQAIASDEASMLYSFGWAMTIASALST